MIEKATHYPKFLAFMRLFYPNLYHKLSFNSRNSEIAEANLIYSNSMNHFQAIIYSEDVSKHGELFNICTNHHDIAPYSWDWRWVFAVKIIYKKVSVISIKFNQQVIALPTGKHPLNHAFFDILRKEYEEITKELIDANKNMSVHVQYEKYCNTVNL